MTVNELIRKLVGLPLDAQVVIRVEDAYDYRGVLQPVEFVELGYLRNSRSAFYRSPHWTGSKSAVLLSAVLNKANEQEVNDNDDD